MASSRPHIVLSAAASVDGRIATRTGDSGLSSASDLARLHRMRSRADGILVGRNTVTKDDPMLNVRRVRGRNPVRIVLDSRGRISPRSRIMATAGKIPTIIAVSKSAPAANVRRLSGSPAEVITAGKNSVSLRPLLRKLLARGIRTLLVEGGAAVNWEFVRQGLFDELVLTVSPRIIAGTTSVPLVGGDGFGRISNSPRLRLISARRLGNHVVLSYKKV